MCIMFKIGCLEIEFKNIIDYNKKNMIFLSDCYKMLIFVKFM